MNGSSNLLSGFARDNVFVRAGSMSTCFLASLPDARSIYFHWGRRRTESRLLRVRITLRAS